MRILRVRERMKQPMRLNLELNESQADSLQELRKRTGAGTTKDLVNHALTMLEWMVDEIDEGSEITAVNTENKTYRVLITPLLQYVAKQRERELARQREAERERELARQREAGHATQGELVGSARR